MASLSVSTVEEQRNVLIIGRSGSGKSTIANAIANRKTFPESAIFSPGTKLPIEQRKINIVDENDQQVKYKVKLLDTKGLFDASGWGNAEKDHENIFQATKTHINSNRLNIHLALFVFEYSHGSIQEKDIKAFEALFKFFSSDFSSVSALIITHCDRENVKTRTEIESDFKTNPKSVFISKFMKKGIVTVGLPSDLGKTNEGVKSYLEDQMRSDKKKLVTMVKEANEPLYYEKIWPPELQMARSRCIVQ